MRLNNLIAGIKLIEQKTGLMTMAILSNSFKAKQNANHKFLLTLVFINFAKNLPDIGKNKLKIRVGIHQALLLQFKP